jgi:hypothetical protein
MSGTLDAGAFDEALLDQAVAEVQARALAWAATSARERAHLLERVVNDTYAVAEEWTAVACAAKGYDPHSTEGGEELFSGLGTFVSMAQSFRQSMLDIAAKGRPQYPGPVRHKPDNRIAIQVVPRSIFDKVLYAGITGEVWMEPGVDEDQVKATQAEVYQSPTTHAGVSLVLGAGNVGSLGPRDVLTKLFGEGKVVVLKANPVNDYLVLARRDRGRPGGRVPDESRGRERYPRDRFGQDTRRDRFWRRPRRRTSQGEQPTAGHQAGELRTGQRLARGRRAWRMDQEGDRLSGSSRGDDDRQQRGFQLSHATDHHHPRGLGPA